jgi:hypothetical protein
VPAQGKEKRPFILGTLTTKKPNLYYIKFNDQAPMSKCPMANAQ